MISIKALKICLIIHTVNLFACTQVSAQWQPVNGPDKEGQINQINSRDSVLYACTESGLYSSVHGSSVWTRLSSGLPSKPILDIDFLGSDIFVALEGSGVYKSGNNGLTWNNYSLGITDTIVQTIKVIDTVLFAGTKSQGLFVSKNRGLNWTHVSAVNGTFVSEIETHGTILYVSVAGFGVYVSFDQGLTWSLPSSVLSTYPFTSMAVDSTRVLITSNGDNAFISFDTCKTWINLNVTNYSRAAFIHGADLYLSPFGGPIRKSSDNGLTWTNIPIGQLSSISIYDFHFIDSLLYVGTYNAGMYTTNDNGLSWSNSSVGIRGWISSIAAIGSNIFAATLGNGLYRTPDLGATWIKCDSGLTEQYIFSIASLFGYIYAGTSSGLYLSTDLGVSWNIIPGMSGFGINIVEVIGSRIYTGRSTYPYVHYSNDGGLTWIPTTVITTNGCRSIAGRQNYVLAGSYFSTYASLSDDFGVTWSSISTNPVSSSIISSTFIPGFAFAGGSTIWRTELPGNNWSQTAAGWPLNTWVQCMHTQGGVNILAGGNKGIFLSINQGVSWGYYSFGLDYKNILDIYEDSGMLYLATSNGIWSQPVITNIEEELYLTEVNTIAVFPNPATDELTVRWLPESKFESLSMLNGMGQVVYTSDVNSMHQTTINIDKFVPGVYYLTIQNETKTIFEKVIIY